MKAPGNTKAVKKEAKKQHKKVGRVMVLHAVVGWHSNKIHIGCKQISGRCVEEQEESCGHAKHQ